MQNVPRRFWRFVSPHTIDECVCGYHLVGADDQVSEYDALSGPAEGNGATLSSDLERPKNLEPHPWTVRLPCAPGKAGSPLFLHRSSLQLAS